MKKKEIVVVPKRKRRDPAATPARLRKAGPMGDKRKGSRQRQREKKNWLSESSRP
ncbi:MAG: hypothetical protein ACRD44_16850 [Bryobacteraceae bacterium]